MNDGYRKMAGGVSRVTANVVWLCAVVLVGALSVQAAEIGQEADPLAQGDMQGWVTFTTNPDGSVSINFYARPGGSATTDPFRGAAVATTGAFLGNYPAAAVKAISFTLEGNGTKPSQYSKAILKCANGEWSCMRLRVSDVAGEPVLNYIPLTLDAGWYKNSRDMEAEWQDAVGSVEWVGVQLEPSTVNAESYKLDNFQLVGDGFITDLQEALLARFNALSVDEVGDEGAADSDGDGAGDLDEVIWGTDADSIVETPAVRIVSVTEQGVTIRWPVSEGAPYKVYRAGALVPEQPEEDFVAIELELTPTAEEVSQGYKLYTDTGAGDGKPYFYKVAREITE